MILGAITLFVAAAALGSASGSARAAEVRIEVHNLRSINGRLACALYASAQGFPRDASRALSKMFRPIVGGSGICVFKGLPAGVYAALVFHDENGSGVLDSNLFGAPSKGYGVSNNHTYPLSPPRWPESSFSLSATEAKTLEIRLRY